MESKTLLTRSEAAKYLNVSLPTIDKYAAKGLIKAERKGRVIRIKKDDLVQALKSTENLLSVREAADLMVIGQAAVRNYMGSGRLESVKLGTRVRIKREEIERFMSERSNDKALQEMKRWEKAELKGTGDPHVLCNDLLLKAIRQIVSEELAKHLSKAETSPPQKEFLTSEEACEYIGIKRSTLYKLTFSKAIPYHKPNGKKIFFERTKLDAWLKSNPVRSDEELEIAADTYITTSKLKRK